VALVLLGVQKLQEMDKEFFVKGFVHDAKTAAKLARFTGASLGDRSVLATSHTK